MLTKNTIFTLFSGKRLNSKGYESQIKMRDSPWVCYSLIYSSLIWTHIPLYLEANHGLWIEDSDSTCCKLSTWNRAITSLFHSIGYIAESPKIECIWGSIFLKSFLLSLDVCSFHIRHIRAVESDWNEWLWGNCRQLALKAIKKFECQV